MLKPFHQNILIEAGCDEAGRGCLAGPVFAAAVILPVNFYHPLLNDSKQVKEQDRNELRIIIEAEAVAFAVASIDNNEIDSINILKASFKAMHQALDKLEKRPELLLIDGNRFYSYQKIPHECIVQGDGIYASIAAASILAKTYRDDFMCQLDEQFPEYKWRKNKGYGTAEHREALMKFGMTTFHRKTFQWQTVQIGIEF